MCFLFITHYILFLGLEFIMPLPRTYVATPADIEKKWVFQWQKKGFKGKKNADLWKRFLLIYHKHNVSFQWVKGHAGHPENEKCDQLAVEASDFNELLIDQGYEQSINSNTLF